MIKRRTLIIIASSLLLAISVPAIGLYWLCYTESGLQWLGARVTSVGKVRIRLDGLHGRLTGPLTVAEFELDHERVHMVASDIRADVKLRSALFQTLHADYVEVGTVSITVKPRTQPPSARAPHFLPRWLRVRVDSFAIDTAQLVLQSGRTFNASGIRAATTMTTGTLTLEQAAVTSEQFVLTGNAELGARDPLGMAGNLEWIVNLSGQPRWAGRARVSGDLKRLEFSGQVAEPLLAQVSGALSDLTGDWHWDANTKLTEFTLKPWSPESTLGLRSAVLTGKGNRDGFQFSGVADPLRPETGPLDVSFVGSYADRTLRADELRLAPKSGRGVLNVSGTAAFVGKATELALQGDWRNLGWPLTSPAVVRSSQGKFTFAGTMPYRYTMSGEITVRDSPPIELSSQGAIDRESLRFEKLQAHGFDGELSAGGELNWARGNAWKVDGEIRRFNPAKFDSRFPGRIAISASASGVGFDRKAPWSANLRNLQGTLRSQPVKGHGRVSHERGSYSVAGADVRFGTAHLVASGRYGGRHSLTWQLSVPDASQLLPETSGSLTSQGTLSGSEGEPRLIASLSALNLVYLDNRLGELSVETNLDPSDQRESHLQLSGTDLKFGERGVRSVQITLDGRASAHQLKVVAEGDDVHLALGTQSGFVEGVWRGEIRQLDARIVRSTLALTAPARFALSKELAELDLLCLTGAAERACARGQWHRAGTWNLAVDAAGIPLQVLGASSTRDSRYAGLLSVQANATQEAGQPWVGKGTATFADGVFSYLRASGEMQDVEIGAGRATFDATPQRFGASVRLDAAEAAMLDANGSADRTVSADWRKLPLRGSLEAETRELGFLPLIVPEIDRAAGKLQANLRLGGTLGLPEVSGSLVLSEGELDMYTVNMQLRKIALRVDLADNALKLTASLGAGKGTAEMAGNLEWRKRQPFGQLKFKGENLELVNVPEARVLVSPDLRFRIDGRKIGVDGAVRVPSAFLTPADLSGAVLPSSDEVIVGREPEGDDKGFEVTTGIQLVLGKDVRIDSYGLEARIEGNVAAYAAPNEVSTATGELRIAEGKYSAYTRELDIERGRLIFSGGLITDPGVDLRASKEFPEATVGVNVRGTLRNPRLSFWSEPQLPQSQIASLIVAGGDIGSMGDPDAVGGQETRDQLVAQGSAILANQLGQQLGLDLEEVRVESDVNDQTRLVLGRYLSPRFYVSYGISLTEAINTLKLRYTINDRWTIRSEAGENRSADLEYKIEH